MNAMTAQMTVTRTQNVRTPLDPSFVPVSREILEMDANAPVET